MPYAADWKTAKPTYDFKLYMKYQNVYKGWPRANYLKNFKISVSHTPLRYASLRMPNGNRARLRSQTHDFLKFNAPFLRGKKAFSTDCDFKLYVKYVY